MNIIVQKGAEYYSVPLVELLKGTEQNENEVREVFENFNTSEYIVSVKSDGDTYQVILNRAYINRKIEATRSATRLNSYKNEIRDYLPQDLANQVSNLFNIGDEPFTFRSRKGIFFEFKVVDGRNGSLRVTTDYTYVGMRLNSRGEVQKSAQVPLPNVYPDSHLCWGSRNGMDNFTIQDLSELNRIPDLFLASIFNDDLSDAHISTTGITTILQQAIQKNESETHVAIANSLLNNDSFKHYARTNAYTVLLTMNLFNLSYDILF